MSASTGIVEDTLDRKAAQSARAAGVWSPVLMPVDRELRIDVKRLLVHVRWLLAQGCHGLAMFGTTSEATSFTANERMAVLDAVLDAGVAPDQIMVGAGCAALGDSVALARHAGGAGCRRLLMLPPFYYKGVADAGQHRSFATVLDRAGSNETELYLYNFPKLSGVPITHGVIERLIESHGTVVAGLKDSSGEWSSTSGFIEAFPSLAIFPGSEALLLDGLRAGGAGCITACANVNPTAIRGVYDAWQTSAADAHERYTSIRAVRKAIEAHPAVAALKHITAHYRADPEWRRTMPPLVDLDPDAGSELIDALESAGFEPRYD